MVTPRLGYMHRHYLDEIVNEMMARDSGWEFVTSSITSSALPGPRMVSEFLYTPAERKDHARLQLQTLRSHVLPEGIPALTLKRMDRPKDAMLVWGERPWTRPKTPKTQGHSGP